MFLDIKSKKLKYALGLLGAIIIGAIGSGIWEVVFQPVFSFLSNNIISLFSLLFKSLEKSIYEDIAKGYTEEPSYMAATLILYIFFMMLGYFTSHLIPEKKKKNDELDEIEKELKKLKLGENVLAKLDEIEKKLDLQRDKLRERGRIILSILILLLVFLFSLLFILKYKLDKISSFEQTIKAVKPFISQNEYDLFNSSFARIKNSTEYNKILDSLNSLALKNNIEINK